MGQRREALQEQVRELPGVPGPSVLPAEEGRVVPGRVGRHHALVVLGDPRTVRPKDVANRRPPSGLALVTTRGPTVLTANARLHLSSLPAGAAANTSVTLRSWQTDVLAGLYGADPRTR